MATKIPGYTGQLLDIDLTSKSIKKVDLDAKLAREYIGGRALGGKMLLDAYGTNWAKVDPLSPEALLLVLGGPFVGFIGCKTNFVFKSPQTFGIVGAQGSGDFIPELRFSGYDGIILRGKASSPSYITIFDDQVEIKDASQMWGKEIRETHKMITDEYGSQTSQYYIGPAGENLVRYAAAITEWYRAAGRGGAGAVMGSKNLKAIVCRGTGPTPEVADQKKLNDVMTWARQNLASKRVGTLEYGTASGVFRTGNSASSEPIRNWQSEWHDQVQVRGEFFAAEHWVRRYWADYGCVMACSKLGRVKYGKRAGLVAELPDYEAGALEGTNFGIFDINDIAYTTSRPDELGLDLIAAGNVCSWACEAQEKGILTAADLGGIQLKWGEADGFVKLMDAIAYRKGEIPKLLGEGLAIATKKIGKGSEAFAVHVKGMELGAHGARSGRDKNELSYTVSAHGGDHMSTVTPEGEGALWRDSSCMCSFQSLTHDQEIEWLQAITGFGITKDELDKVMVPRWTTMNRVPLLLHGWTYKDDVNPLRFYQPLPEGPFAGKKVEKSVENQKKQDYYKALGWDTQGVPTTETLRKCGLEAFDGALQPLRAKA
jgi:aldehyde:ferredoxin oxidoreductase